MKNLILVSILFLSIVVIQAPVFGQKKGKLTAEEKEKLQNARVMIVRYEAPPLSFMSPKDVAGTGLISNLTKSA